MRRGSPDLRNFYPRPLRGGRPSFGSLSPISSQFLSTPSARRATLNLCQQYHEASISIHALCEEGDKVSAAGHGKIQISIHALCEEGDHQRIYYSRFRQDFYPRPLRGGRPAYECPYPLALAVAEVISIHALCEEGDANSSGATVYTDVFLSTPSARRATCLSACGGGGPHNFYPRPLRGGRPAPPSRLRHTA